jgi:hypothetical protein
VLEVRVDDEWIRAVILECKARPSGVGDQSVAGPGLQGGVGPAAQLGDVGGEQAVEV